eukprot:SAG22_NODE_39_length_26283_cov_18.486653_11_plen_48_part_00
MLGFVVFSEGDVHIVFIIPHCMLVRTKLDTIYRFELTIKKIYSIYKK